LYLPQINEQYNGNGQRLFEVDGRGVHDRDWILHEEDYLNKFVKNMQTDRRLSIDRQAKFVNNDLFKDKRTGVVDLATLSKHGLQLPLPNEQVWRLMRRARGVVGE
jgi:hypothetical protein